MICKVGENASCQASEIQMTEKPAQGKYMKKKIQENEINKTLGTVYFSLLEFCCSEYKCCKNIQTEQTGSLVAGMSLEF